MSYEVLARKWRPSQFSDVVGQDHVTHTLGNAIKTDRVAHAYLFVGPRGTGKTSIARIFAKALNCVKGPTAKPCDACPSCREVASGTSLDVQEIDGASHRGIDEIRSLRETVKYVSAGRYRIYIIDEVHMLTTEAFNALLKTLEEPPPHVKFLFATTEPHKIPPTILSRCQRFDLRRIPVKLLMERLSVIAESEKISVDENVLPALARAAEGSLRDAESALDQLISFKGKSIKESDVTSVFGLISLRSMEELTDAIMKGDIVAVIRLVDEFDNQGKDMQRMLVELLGHFLQLLALIQGGDEAVNDGLEALMLDMLKRQAEDANVDRLLKIMEILIETMDRLRYALSKKILMEIALIRCARSTAVISLDSILSRIRELRNSLSGLAEGSRAISGENPPLLPLEQVNAGVQEQKDDSYAGGKAREKEDDLSWLKKNWRSVIDHMGHVAVLARNALLDSVPVSVSGDVVTIGFDREFPERIEHMRVARNRNVLNKELIRVLGRQVAAEFVLTDVNPGKETIPAAGTADETEPPPDGKKKKGSMRKWLDDEIVRKTMDMFNGSIVDVKE